MADSRYTTLAGWLRAKPPLAGVRIDGDDKRIVRVVARQFATAEEAITALDPTTLEGLDAHGAIIRSWKCKDGATAAAERASSLAQREPWPESDTAQLGQVITAACDRAAARHENAYRYSFDKLEALYREQSQRLAGLEQMLLEGQRARILELEAEAEALRQENEQLAAKALAEAASTSTADNLVNTVVAAGMQKMLGGGQKPAAPNGAQQ